MHVSYDKVDLSHVAQMHYFFDSAFPAGSYGHSFGFETFATSKLGGDRGQALEWIRNYMVFSLWYGDLENISKARTYLEQSPTRSLEGDILVTLDKRLHATRSTIEARRSARSLASSLKAAASRLFADKVGDGVELPSLDFDSRTFLEPSTFVALLSHDLGWDEDYTKLLYIQGQALLATSVLIRCGKIGQFSQLEMMAELIDLSAKLASARPSELQRRGAVTAWAIEVDQINHQNLSPRLFQS